MRLASTFAALAVSTFAAGCGDTATPVEGSARSIGDAIANTTMYANIQGRTAVAPEDVCQWEASVYGGTPPYTYHWSNNRNQQIGTDSTYQVSFTIGATITLTVTDADNQTATDTHAVGVYRHTAPCLLL